MVEHRTIKVEVYFFISDREAHITHLEKIKDTYFPAQLGIMETLKGEDKGQHDSLMYSTIVQRQGLGIGI